ncbi:type II secretion system GspH family protein [Lysinibacillus xylanilyticus]|uniref:type IV pilus modification PilV family protein n=1 Tax=Lysinibacillus xylanilyticus TaxID=582475 RepID=UPI002B23F76B|nr:type II secretion system protein [Lysinibacillus xylanilyticus]MEB2302763.1 type II secretion system GspH family protein [Lysinibacillus xylanilyticus]
MTPQKILNERGISLVEVVASIVILAILLISIVNLLPQMGLKNNQNEDKQVSINLASKELAYWQSILKSDFNSLLANPDATYSFIESGDALTYDNANITITTTSTKSMASKYHTKIIIKRTPDLHSLPTKANQICIFIYKNNNILVTENYGYVFY